MGHHYVPQRYLQNFEDPKSPGAIWLHDKRGGVAKSLAIKSVAQAKRYYSQETEERLAREVEKPGNQVIAKLIDGAEISVEERRQLAFYIGTMIKRGPRRRRQSAEMLPVILKGVIANLRDGLSTLKDKIQVDPEQVAKRLREVDAIQARYSAAPPQNVLDQMNEPWPSAGIVDTIFDMSWRVLVASRPQLFITSDNPAFFFNQYGLGDKRAELSFPFASTHALHGSWSGPERGLCFLTVPQKTVEEINRRIASGTECLGFYHEKAPWLLQLLSEKNACLNRIWFHEGPPARSFEIFYCNKLTRFDRWD